jgi:hypothetical protein
MDVEVPVEGKVQGRRDSNPQPAVLETAALPVELLPLEVVRIDRVVLPQG